MEAGGAVENNTTDIYNIICIMLLTQHFFIMYRKLEFISTGAYWDNSKLMGASYRGVFISEGKIN